MNLQRARFARLGGLVLMSLLFLLWSCFSASGHPLAVHIPSPCSVARVMAEEISLIASSVLVSLRRTLLAFVLGGSVGMALGFMHGILPLFRRITGPCIEGLRPLPSVALIPLALLLVGMGDGLNVLVAAFACAWPIFVSTYDGVLGVSPVLQDAAKVMGMGRYDIVRSVIFPASLPAVATGVRISLGIAFAVEISVEMVVPKQGLGALATTAAFAGQNALLYAAIVVAAVVGCVIGLACRRLEDLFLRRYGPEWSGRT